MISSGVFFFAPHPTSTLNISISQSGRHREPLFEMLPLTTLDGRVISEKPNSRGGGGRQLNSNNTTTLSVEHLISAASEGGVKLFEPSIKHKANTDDDININSSERSNSSVLTSSRGAGCGRLATSSSINKMKDSQGWLGTVDQLIIDSAYLTSLRPLIMDLTALRIVSFRNNKLNNSCLSDLGAFCPNLEEISLENNHLDHLVHLWHELTSDTEDGKEEVISPYSGSGGSSNSNASKNASSPISNPNSSSGWFRHLKKFDCGHNHLTSLDDTNVDTSSTNKSARGSISNKSSMVVLGLERLTQLSLESNQIRTLGSIRSLVGLMELYMGNNEIAELAEIDHLKVRLYTPLLLLTLYLNLKL